jgi:hypothetical protein
MSRAFLLAVALAVAGCAGYRLGPTLGAEYRSVAVPMFRNKTYKPQLEAQITNSIIKRFQADGTLRVESVADADIILTGEITDYRRHQLRSARTDTGAPREYRVSIDAKIEARDRVTGKLVLAPTVVTGSADTFIGADLQSAEQQALPLIADDLAKQVVTLLAEKW